MTAIELRMHELVCTVLPADTQLYCQALLIDHKELPHVPDRHVGIETTLLRALASHPRIPLSESEMSHQSFVPVAPMAVTTPVQAPS